MYLQYGSIYVNVPQSLKTVLMIFTYHQLIENGKQSKIIENCEQVKSLICTTEYKLNYK